MEHISTEGRKKCGSRLKLHVHVLYECSGLIRIVATNLRIKDVPSVVLLCNSTR